MDGDSTAALRRAISAAWRRFREGKRVREERRSWGSYREGLDGIYCEITAGSKSPAFPVTERKRREIRGEEGADGWGPPVGEGKRERGYRFGLG
jgi:hypothetical protein